MTTRHAFAVLRSRRASAVSRASSRAASLLRPAVLLAALALSGCVFGGGDDSGDDAWDETAPVRFLDMTFTRADTLTAPRVVEVGGVLYATNGLAVYASADAGGSWRAISPASAWDEVGPFYLLGVGGALYVKPRYGDTAYMREGEGWRAVYHGYSLPSAGEPYAFSAGGKDYVCALSQLYFAYGHCGEVLRDADTVKFVQRSSSEIANRGHFVSGDTLYLMRRPGGQGHIEALSPASAAHLDLPDSLRGERFAFFDGAVFLTSHSDLWKVSGNEVALVNVIGYQDDGINDPGLDDNGYAVLETVGRNLLFAGAGTGLSYLHAGSEVPAAIPFFADKDVLDVHVRAGVLVVATRGGIYRARLKT